MGFGRALRYLIRYLPAVATHPSTGVGEAWLGLNCKTSIRHYLDGLSLRGYRIYDDFPAQESTIDHIAVGPHGVFSIETGRPVVPPGEKGLSNITMIHDDGRTMPSRMSIEAASIDQARRRAGWLSGWLSGRLGQTVDVYPMIVLSGRLHNRNRRGDVILVNKKDYESLVAERTNELSDAAIERIDRQLESRYHNHAATGS